jgi:hypothetical protein
MFIKLCFRVRRRWYQHLFEADRHRRTGRHVPPGSSGDSLLNYFQNTGIK